MAQVKTEQRKFDPILVEVIKNGLASVNEEMAIAVHRTGRSAMVKVGDFATVVCDRQGRVVGEGAAPFQSAIFMLTLENILKQFGDDFKPGDIVISNDPYTGMGHLPDVSIFAPVFWKGRRVAHTISYSHHMDIGGRFAGGFSSQPRSSYEEGLRIPIMKLYEAGVRNERVVDIIRANVRAPEEWLGDIEAKIAGARRGDQAIHAILDKYGVDAFDSTCDYLVDNAERAMRAAIRAIPPGVYVKEDLFEDEGYGGVGKLVPVRIKLTLDGETATVDFTGTAPQSQAAINLPLSSTLASVYSSIKCLVSPDVLTNVGIARAIKVIVPEGCLCNPQHPAAVGGRTALLFRVIDTVFRLIGEAVPGKVGIPGEGGDMLHYSTERPGGGHSSFADLYFGGWGGRPTKDGIDAVAPMTFGSYGSVPAEVLEREYPVVVEGFGLVTDTEGPGKFRGAMGMYKQWRFLAPGNVTIRTNRLTTASAGLHGGSPGALSLNVFKSANGTEREMDRQTIIHAHVEAGDAIYHRVAASGGYGDPATREPLLVLQDFEDGKLSAERAREVYKVAIDVASRAVDWKRTAALRTAM